MIPLEDQPILTAAQMRAVEDDAIAAGTGVGTGVDTLMARAGAGIAAAVRRLVSEGEVLILCGPGNNGGDGYVVAAALAGMGLPVRVAASADPATDAAARARAGWGGPVVALADAAPAPVIVDALFGTGLSRPLSPEVAAALHRLLAPARLRIAVDVPSGVDTDTGALLGVVDDEGARFHLTLALGAAKPAHVLHPAAGLCGTVRIVDIGLPGRVPSDCHVIAPPVLASPGPADHKYSRGMVAVVGGAMPGASRLAATAALRAGAGYVALLGGGGTGGGKGPDALVRRPLEAGALRDPRIGAVVIGPGLGRSDEARRWLDQLLADDAHPLVIDGDALHLLDPDALRHRAEPVILTPHAGEFAALFGPDSRTASPLDRARAAAARTGATIVFKGATTVIASPDAAIVSPNGNPWLSTAGTGDVLAGAVAAMLARPGADPLTAAAAGVWLHAEAAHRLGASFIADDVAAALTAARGSL